MGLVVLGHLLEYRLANKGLNYLYMLIYLFHMPAFAFVSGCVTRYSGESSYWRKSVTDVLLPYLLFHTLYSLLAFHAAGKPGAVQYTTPYWLLWFLMALLIWRSLLPVYTQMRWPFPVALLVGLVAAFAKDIGYYLSLSRALAFFPFFLLGALLGRHELFPRVPKLLAGVVSLVILLMVAYWVQDMSKVVVYRGGALSALGMGALNVVALYAALTVAALAGIRLLQMLPSQRIPYVSPLAVGIIGAYLVHGMLVRFVLPPVLSRGVIPGDGAFLAASVGVAMMIVLSCSVLAIKLPYLFNFRWLETWFFGGRGEKERSLPNERQ